jgi:hypothetical protein
VVAKKLSADLAVAELYYTSPSGDRPLLIIETTTDIGPAKTGGSPTPANVQGEVAERNTRPDKETYVVYSWRKAGLTIHAGVDLKDERPRAEVEELAAQQPHARAVTQ